MARLDVHGGAILIDAPPSPRLPVVMKRIRAQRRDRLWTTPSHRGLDVIDMLHHTAIERSPAFDDLEYRLLYGSDMDHVQACLALKRGLEPPGTMPELRKPLYPYQEQAVAFLDRAGSGILADEPGLGKTLQGISFALLRPGPCLVVCPATAKHVWAREVAASSNETAAILQGTKPQTLPDAKFLIINYDVLEHHEEALAAHGFTTLIADEAHRAKNIRARRTKALIRLADQIPRKLLLSGTLLMNSPEDLFPPLRIVRPEVYPDFGAFCDRYMHTRSIKKKVRGRLKSQTVREGSQRLPELHHRMDAFTIRRTLAQVRDQLPELRHTFLEIDLPDDLRTAYRTRIGPAVRAGPGAERLRAANDALSVCIEAKSRVLADLVEDRLALDGRKTLVFSTRLALLDAVDQRPRIHKAALRIDGSVPADTRRAIEDQFQTDDSVRVFLGQTRACGEALTLDAADTVLIAEADWSPQANEQAIRRALRINTDHPVEVVWLVVRGTLDEARLAVLERKKAEFGIVMDGANPEDLLREALHGCQEPAQSSRLDQATPATSTATMSNTNAAGLSSAGSSLPPCVYAE